MGLCLGKAGADHQRKSPDRGVMTAASSECSSHSRTVLRAYTFHSFGFPPHLLLVLQKRNVEPRQPGSKADVPFVTLLSNLIQVRVWELDQRWWRVGNWLRRWELPLSSSLR